MLALGLFHDLARSWDQAWWFTEKWIGGTDGSGPIYLVESGFLGIVTLGPAIFLAYWHHTCHVERCMRIAKYPVGTRHKACKKHHPAIDADGKITAETLHAHWHEHRDLLTGRHDH